MEVVRIRKCRRPEGFMLWRAYAIEEDDFGTWLYTPEGSIVRGQRGGHVGSSYVGLPDKPGLHVLHLVPVTGWWFATWANDGVGQRVAVDICTPPVLTNGEWVYDDLELDVHRRVFLLDIVDGDEFDDGCAFGRISPEEAGACRAAATEVHRRLRDGDALFDAVAWDRLQATIDLGLRPLTLELHDEWTTPPCRSSQDR